MLLTALTIVGLTVGAFPSFSSVAQFESDQAMFDQELSAAPDSVTSFSSRSGRRQSQSLQPVIPKTSARMIILGSGQAVSGVAWSLKSTDQELVLTSDDHGRIKVPVGQWTILAADGNWIPLEPRVLLTPGREAEIHVAPARQLEVQVLDPDGRPFGSVSVRWASQGVSEVAWPEHRQVTSEDGIARFVVPVVPCALDAKAESGATAKVTLPGGPAPDQSLVLVLPTADEERAPIRVIGEADRRPIANASLRAGQEELHTDESGVAMVPLRWVDEFHGVSLSARGYQPCLSRFRGELPVEVAMAAAAELRIQVVDEAGFPVAGTQLHVWAELRAARGAKTQPLAVHGLASDDEGYCVLPCKPDSEVQVYAVAPDDRFGELYLAKVEQDSTQSLVVRTVEALRFRLADRQGRSLDARSASIRCVGVDYRPRPWSIDGHGRLLVPAPAFVRQIVIDLPGNVAAFLEQSALRESKLPHVYQDAGGDVELILSGAHRVAGRVIDEWDRAMARTAFRLVPQRVPALRPAEGDVPLAVTNSPLWSAKVSAQPLQLRTDEHGEFQIGGVPEGLWTLERSETRRGSRSLGSGGNTDHPFVVPQAATQEFRVAGVLALSLKVVDAFTGRPVPQFTLRQAFDPVKNSSVAAEKGRKGFLQTMVRTSVLGELELAASGYQVEGLFLPTEAGTEYLQRVVQLQPAAAGMVEFLGEYAAQLQGAVVQITDVGERGMSMPGRERWCHRLLVDGTGSFEFPAPGAPARLRLRLATHNGAGLRFEPSEFLYTPGDHLQVLVVKATGS